MDVHGFYAVGVPGFFWVRIGGTLQEIVDYFAVKVVLAGAVLQHQSHVHGLAQLPDHLHGLALGGQLAGFSQELV